MHKPIQVIEDGGLAALAPAPAAAAPATDPAADPGLLQAARELLRAAVPADLLDPFAPAELRDPEVLRALRAAAGAQSEAGRGPLRGLPTDEPTLLRVFRESLGWGPAQPYLDDERVQEVKIIGDLIMVQEQGADFALVPERFASAQQPLDRALMLASWLNVPLDRSRPQETLPLAHGTRVHVTIPPCTPEGGALICIRRGRRQAWDLADIRRRGACDDAVAELLRLLVRAGCSFLIAGETGCGKTALLEALINSWPGTPHVVTIEDNTQEISVRHRAWTRELVQSAAERGAFGRAAREVLRQTPSLVAPGETRADEAGAILAVAVSGHAVATTIHARSALRAVQRFADCAAMPGAYLYEGRREHALEDACDNFHAVVHLERRGGRRYLSELILLDGAAETEGRLRPRAVALAWAEIGAEGQVAWRCAARAAGDALVWDGPDQTPAQLRARLRGLALGAAPAAAGRQLVDAAVERARALAAGGGYEQALAALRRAWAERPDQRLVEVARSFIGQGRPEFAGRAEAAAALAGEVRSALRRRDLAGARATVDSLMADLVAVAAHTPLGGWAALAEQVAAAETADRAAAEQIAMAGRALADGRPHAAAELLAACPADALPPPRARAALELRRAALAELIAAGELAPAALAPVEAALAALVHDPGSDAGIGSFATAPRR